VSLDGGEVEQLSHAPGMYGAVLSRDGEWLAVTGSSPESAPAVELISTNDGSRRPLRPAEERPTAASLGLEPPEIISLPAADGKTGLFGMVYAPPDREPGRKYPVIVSVYGGPHAQSVTRSWAATVDLRAQYLAQNGFVVLKVDNRGSAGRGLDFEAPLSHAMGTVEVDDQAAAVEWLAENYHFVDRERVGVYGWSYGGYMTLLCMGKRPDLFRVGVAGAPVTHYGGYDTGYTERYMGKPAEDPGAYERGSVMAHAAGIDGPLLIVHGMIDENVHFRHTARLLVELSRLGKPFELLIYPEERHMPRDARGLEDHERRVLGFLMQHLGG
jgi:dipeptidyl-peptidase-4